MRRMNQRDMETMMRAHKTFYAEIRQIVAARMMEGNGDVSVAKITKDIVECPSFPLLKEELLKNKKKMEYAIRLDRGVL